MKCCSSSIVGGRPQPATVRLHKRLLTRPRRRGPRRTKRLRTRRQQTEPLPTKRSPGIVRWGPSSGGLAGGAIAGATGTSGARTGWSEQSSNQQNPWLGNWVSADPQTRDIARLTIGQRGQQIVVRAWGGCRPMDCNWGYASATDTGRSLAVQWNQGSATRDMRIYSQRDGLRVSVRSVYNDNRTITVTGYFVRAQ